MKNSILLSFEMEGKEYTLANNREVVKRAAQKEPKVFNDLLKQKKGEKSFAELFEENDKVQLILKTLFSCSLVLGTVDNIEYEEAGDIYEVLWYNLDDESREKLSDKLMGLINNTDFIKGSNQRQTTIKMKF